MVKDAFEPDLVKYIDAFTRFAISRAKKGETEIFLIYKNGDETSEMQFNHFKNYIGIRFGNNLTVKEKEVRDKIAARILPIDVDSTEGKQLMAESRKWGKKIVKDDAVIVQTFPTFLDAVTHQKVAEGFITVRPLKDMLNKKFLPKRRTNFKELYTVMLDRECDAVGCGLKSRAEIKIVDGKKKKQV